MSSNPHLHLVVTEHGGHVGYVAGGPFAPRFWGEAQMLAFLASQNAKARPV